MKILFTLTRAFNPNDAGVQRTTYKLGRYFTEQGHEVSYFSTKASGHVPVEFGTLYAVQKDNGPNSKASIRFLKQTLDSVAPDIVINQMPYEKNLREALGRYKTDHNYRLIGCLRNSLFSFISNVRLKTKLILPGWLFQLVDYSIVLKAVKFLHILKHRRDLKSILDIHDYYVLLAPQNRDELQYFVGSYKSERIFVLPNSIPDVFPESLPFKEKTILYVGSLNVEQKRADLLLDFWEKVCRELSDWRFIIVGHGPYSHTIEQQLKIRKLPRVKLAGFQKPEPYYKAASIFVMTSAYEGFPNTILEAQSYGCPVLAFKSYAALESIVNDRADALLSKPYNIKQLAEQAIVLATDTSRLRSMQQAALENARRFTIDKVGQQWLQLLRYDTRL